MVARDDGSAAHPIAIGCRPAISPNGKWVAFTTYIRSDHRYNCNGRMALIATRGGHTRRITASGAGSELRGSWSPDSRYLGTSLGTVWDTRTARAYRIPDYEGVAWDSGAVQFSPDSSRVLVQNYGLLDESGVYEARLRPWAPRAKPVAESLPIWGRSAFAFESQDGDKYEGPTYFAISLSSTLSGPRKEILRSTTDVLRPIEWSADGSCLLVTARNGSQVHALIIRPKTETVTTLPVTFQEDEPASPQLSQDGTEVIGMREGNVIRESVDGTVTVLARRAHQPDWTD